MARKPNILFIMTDQQRADHVGFMGNRVVQTPHLDGLAASGCVFENAWVSNPVCMPNRATILTGRMPTAHGVIFNDRSWTGTRTPLYVSCALTVTERPCWANRIYSTV